MVQIDDRSSFSQCIVWGSRSRMVAMPMEYWWGHTSWDDWYIFIWFMLLSLNHDVWCHSETLFMFGVSLETLFMFGVYLANVQFDCFYLIFLFSLNVCSLFYHHFVTLDLFSSLLLFLVFYLGYIYIRDYIYSQCLSTISNYN